MLEGFCGPFATRGRIAKVENQYSRRPPRGNLQSKKLIEDVFEVCDRKCGRRHYPQSGYRLRENIATRCDTSSKWPTSDQESTVCISVRFCAPEKPHDCRLRQDCTRERRWARRCLQRRACRLLRLWPASQRKERPPREPNLCRLKAHGEPILRSGKGCPGHHCAGSCRFR